MKLTTLLLLFSAPVALLAQHPGDNLFGTDQIINVDLQFSQTGFWDSLVANYTTETYMKADVTITDNTGVYSYHDIGIRLKGNSSYGHPGNKKSFKIDFNRYVDSLDYDKMEKLNFNNAFKDPTFMREKIIYDICKKDSINAPRSNYANVYMNDTFWGFYEVVEQVDDDFLKTHFDESKYNLFKAGDAFTMGGPPESADLKYYGTDPASYDGKYTLENNTTVNDWSDLIALTDFINNTTDDVFANELAHHFNVEQLMKSMVLYNMFANLDSYLNSARNYYIYDKDSSGIWEWINWDCNEAFGSYSAMGAVTSMPELDLYYYATDRPLYERIVTIPATKALYEEYYCELRTAYFNDDYINAATDALYALIKDAVYADGNKMYTNANFDDNISSDITTGGGPGGGTIYGLKSFVTERNTYLDGVLDCQEIVNAVADISVGDISVYPNPATSYLVIANLTGSTAISLVNMNGQQMMKIDPGPGNTTSVDVSALPAGMYFIRVENGNTISTTNFIKQ